MSLALWLGNEFTQAGSFSPPIMLLKTASFPPSSSIVRPCGRYTRWSVQEVLDAENGRILAVSTLRDHVISFMGSDDSASQLSFRVQHSGPNRCVNQISHAELLGLRALPSIWFHPPQDGVAGGLNPPQGYQVAHARDAGPGDLRVTRLGHAEHGLVLLKRLEPDSPYSRGCPGFQVMSLPEASASERLCGLGIAVLLILSEYKPPVAAPAAGAASLAFAPGPLPFQASGR